MVSVTRRPDLYYKENTQIDYLGDGPITEPTHTTHNHNIVPRAYSPHR